jgi:hypothetical protein
MERPEVAIPRPLGGIRADSVAMNGLGELGLAMGDLFLRDGFSFSTDKDWKPALMLKGGGSLLLERAAEGEGLSLIIAHPLTREWDDFPISRWFVPLMTEWMKAASGWQEADRAVELVEAGMAAPELGFSDHENPLRIVNAAKSERATNLLREAELKESLGIPPDSEIAAAPVFAAASGLPASRERPHEFWPWLVFALIVLALVEVWFSDFHKPQPQQI